MPQELLIRIVNSGHIDYLLTADQAGQAISGSAFHPDQQPTFPDNIKTTLIVPGESVLLFELVLPKTNRAQLLKAIPFALEEQLIDELDTLHFAVSKQQADGAVMIAVVKKTLMQEWLNQCASLKIKPSLIVPDYAAVPLFDNMWHVYLDDSRALLRLNRLQGMSIDIEQLQPMLTLRAAEQAINLPEALVIDYDDGNEHFEVENLARLPLRIDFAEAHSYCMELFQRGLATRIDINLLQGEFVSRGASNKQNFWWRIAGIGLAIWLGIFIASLITQYYVYHARVADLNKQVTTLYKQAYPEAQNVVSPQLRIARTLATAQNIKSGGPFLDTISLVGKQLTSSALMINSINYRNQTLTLSVSASSFDLLNSFVQGLTQQGLSVQQQNAQSENNKVTAQLIIKGANNAG